MTYSRNVVILLVVLLGAMVVGAYAVPDQENGVNVLFVLCEPFGAYSVNLWTNFERLGWNVTTAGTHEVVERCNAMTTDVAVDVVLDASIDLEPFDVLAISPTQGTHLYVSNPAADLRESDVALELVRRANEQGLTLYAGCSSFLVLADAGVLEGRRVVHSDKYRTACTDAGADCSYGGKANPPIIDENIITGTNQRYFALEIPEAIARSLDRLDRFDRSLDHLQLADFALTSASLAPEGALVSAQVHGTPLSDVAYDVCSFEDGFIVVGQTYGGASGNVDAMIIRFGPDVQPIWAKNLGGPGRDTAYGVCTTSDGGIAVAGLTTSAGSGGEDVLVFKLSPNGELLWKQTHGGADADAGFAICEASNGDLLVTGIAHAPNLRLSALCLLRLDEAGEEIWSTYYDGRYHERGHAVVEREDGTILVAGGSSSIGSSNYDMILASFSPEGEMLKVTGCGEGIYDMAEQVILTKNKDAVVVGFGDTGNSSGDPNDALITRLDADGERVWLTRQGLPNSFDYGQGIVELDSGTLLMCGTSTGDRTGRSDVWFLTLSEAGDPLWEQRFGAGVDKGWANALCRIADGRVVSVGWTLSHGFGAHDALVLVLDPALMHP